MPAKAKRAPAAVGRLSEPGIYRDIPTADYYADPAPTPSLTQSLAKIIIERSPLHAWHAHPRLNPDFEPDDATKYDVGNIAHSLMIGRGKGIVVLPSTYTDWRTDAAKKSRKDAAGEGKLAVLEKHFELAQAMVGAARSQLDVRAGYDLFRDSGAGEVMTMWLEGSAWCRQLIDWLSHDHLTFCDYKTTDMNAAPHCLGRMMASAGWHIQAAMAERGLNVLDPKTAGRRRYVFVVQETDPPYAINVVQIGEGPLTMGRKMLDYAIITWGQCLKTKTFPSYPAEIVRPEFPGWAENEWLAREEQHEIGNRNVLMAG